MLEEILLQSVGQVPALCVLVVFVLIVLRKLGGVIADNTRALAVVAWLMQKHTTAQPSDEELNKIFGGGGPR